jgi:outer membrane autotransporter protein
VNRPSESCDSAGFDNVHNRFFKELSSSSALVASSALLLAAIAPSVAEAQQVFANNTPQTASGTINTGVLAPTAGFALFAVGPNGIIQSFSPLTLITGGAGSSGALAGTSSSITIFSGSSITTTGNNAPGLVATGSATLTATNTTISTTQAGSIGAQVTFGGRLSLTGGSITSGGDSLEADGSNSVIMARITASNVTMRTTGTNAVGVLANNAAIDLAGGSVTTTNGPTADGLQATAGTSGRITADGVTVTATGGGIFVGNGASVDFRNGSISSAGFGVQAFAAGTAILNNSSITTTGDSAPGLLATDNSSNISATGVTVNTSGLTSYGASAQNGGTISLTGGSVTTTGPDSVAAIAQGGQLTINGGSFTTGGPGGSTQAYGFYSDGGTLTASNATVLTKSDAGYGAFAAASTVAGSTMSLTNVAIMTQGYSSFGAAASGPGSHLTINGGSITTSGAASSGIFAMAGASVVVQPDASGAGTLIRTTGVGSHGFWVQNSSNAVLGSSLAVNGANVATSGEAASALFMTTGNANINTATILNSTLSSLAAPAIAVAGGGGNVALTNSTVSSGVWLRVGSPSSFPAATQVDFVFAPGVDLGGGIFSTATLTQVASNAATPAIANIVASGSTLTGAAITAPGSTANVTLQNNSVWNVTGDSNLTNLTNDPSQINFSPPAGGVFKTLTVVNYIGAGGSIGLNTFLGGDGSPSDRLVINGGTASGNSPLRITNAGGGGALTTGNGILVVNAINGGSTVPGAFALAGRVAAGPYDYTLFRSSVDASNMQAWYLRSTLDCTLNPANPACAAPTPGPGPGPAPTPAPPNFRPETSLYAAIPSMALIYGRTLLDTLHERVGDEEDLRNRPRVNGVASGAWGRVIGQHGNNEGDPLGVFGSGPKFNYDIGAFQGGQDLLRRDGADGSRDHAGLYAAVGMLNGGVTHFDRTFAGSDSLNAYSLGGYWTHFGARGWYLDAILQGTWYDTKGISGRLPTLTTNGWGFAGSLEAGYPIKLGGGFIIEPQAQIVYQNVSLGDGNDTAATVQFRNIESFAARIGARLARTWALDDSLQPRSITAWIRPSVWNEFRGDPQTLFSSAVGPVPFQSSISGAWFELNAGVDAKITTATSLFASAGYQVSINGNTTAYNGKGGLRIAW